MKAHRCCLQIRQLLVGIDLQTLGFAIEIRLRLKVNLDRLGLGIIRVLQQLTEDSKFGRVSREDFVNQSPLVDLCTSGWSVGQDAG